MTSSPGKTRTCGRSPARATALIALGLSMVAVVVLVPVLSSSQLPDPLATDFNLQGAMQHTDTLDGFVIFHLAFALLGAGGLTILAFGGPRPNQGALGWWVLGLSMASTFPAARTVLTVAANWGHVDATEVGGPPLWHYAVMLGTTVAIGWAVSFAALRQPAATPTLPVPEALPVSDSVQVSWVGTLWRPWRAGLGVVLIILGILMALTSNVMFLFLHPVVGLSTLFVARLVVYTDRRGLLVTYGPWRWPRTRIPIGDIRFASAGSLRRLEWTAPSLRHNWRLPVISRVVRTGPGLVVDLWDGGRFAVSIDDPETAAAVLNREVARRTQHSPAH